MNVWSVVVLIVGIISMAVGIIFNFLRGSYSQDICDLKITCQNNVKRIELLERVTDVIQNELTHINNKLDELLSIKKKAR